MKKAILFAAVLFMCPIAKGQNDGLKLNVQGGMNLSWISKSSIANDGSPTSPKFSGQVGFGLDIPLCTTKIHFQPSVFYGGKGGNYTHKETWNALGVGTITNKKKLSIQQLDIPLNIAICTKDVGGKRTFFYAGPYFGYVFKATFSYEISNSNYGNYSTQVGYDRGSSNELEEGMSKYDYGISLGVRCLFWDMIILDLAYRNSLSDNYNGDEYFAEYCTGRNHSFLLSVGFQF